MAQVDHIIALFLLGAVSYGLLSYFQFHVSSENPTSFFGKESWKRKYKRDHIDRLTPAPRALYYRIFNLKYKEAFPLSATLLVFVTDYYHFFQFVTFQSMFAVVAIHHNFWTWIILLNVVWKAGFGFAYYWLGKEFKTHIK